MVYSLIILVFGVEPKTNWWKQLVLPLNYTSYYKIIFNCFTYLDRYTYTFICVYIERKIYIYYYV